MQSPVPLAAVPDARPARDARLQALLDHSPAVIYACLPGDMRLTFISDSAWQVLGYRPEHMLGDPNFWFDHVHPDDSPNLLPAKARAYVDGRRTHEYRIRTASGAYLWVQDDLRLVRDATDTPQELVGTLVDISARKRAEEDQKALMAQLTVANNELLQSRKMASLGQLASGIAHEINNPLGFIQSNMGTLHSYVEALVRLVRGDEQAARECGANVDMRGRMARLRGEAGLAYIEGDAGALLSESMDGMRRMRDIVRALMDFSRVGEGQPRPDDLNGLVDAALAALPPSVRSRAKIVLDYGELPRYACHARQLEDVFRHLLSNAFLAVQDGGTVRVSTSADASSVTVTVTDDGCGIARPDLGRIFDPFYTTRPVGSGTGLGLALCYGVVSRHGGRIEVESTPGQGSRFAVHLPLAGATG